MTESEITAIDMSLRYALARRAAMLTLPDYMSAHDKAQAADYIARQSLENHSAETLIDDAKRETMRALPSNSFGSNNLPVGSALRELAHNTEIDESKATQRLVGNDKPMLEGV